MSTRIRIQDRGPFQANQLKDGDRYELSNGHPIYCHPSGRQHAGPNLIGGAVLETDPDVEWAGVDAGFSPDPASLRAPDVAVGPAGDEQGWIAGAPPLALEYAGHGQDEADLKLKIAELLAAGTQQVWVVRLLGPRRVEVHRPDAPVLERGFAQGVAQGIEQGIARSILKLLEGRGLAVDESVRERITGCRDTAELERWLLRAAQVQVAGQLFD